MTAYTRTSISLPTPLHRAGVAQAKAQHRDFSGHMAQWLDENPARWYRYRNVADANHARKQAMRGGR